MSASLLTRKQQHNYISNTQSCSITGNSIMTEGREGLDTKYLPLEEVWCLTLYLVTWLSEGEASYDESRKDGAGPGQWVLMVREQFVLITGYNGQRLARDGATHALYHHPRHHTRSGSEEHDQNHKQARPPVIEILSFRPFNPTFIWTLDLNVDHSHPVILNGCKSR